MKRYRSWQFLRVFISVLLVWIALSPVSGICGMNDIFSDSLNNGLDYAVWEQPGTDVVELRIYVKTGSVYEQGYLGTGISHFLEHLTAEGPTARKSKKQVDMLIEKFGNAFNAYTSRDHTCYHITTTKEYYRPALELLAEMVFENRITSKAFKREKGVITREIEKGMEEPNRYLYRLTSENIYRVHPARYPVIGFKPLLLKLTRKDVESYYRKKYVPNNSVVVIGGDVETAEAVKDVKEIFGSYARSSLSIPALPDEPEPLTVRSKLGFRDIDGGYINLSWLTISLYDPDLYALDLLSEILGAGKNARLRLIVKEERKLVNSIGSYSYTPSYGKGEFTVTARFRDSSYEDVRRAILETIAGIAHNGVTEEELERAKKLVLSSYLMGRTSVSGNTASIGTDIVTARDENFSYVYTKNIEKVTAEDVRRAAARYLDPHRYIQTVLLPEDQKELAIARETGNTDEEPSHISLDNGMVVVFKKTPGTGVANYSVFLKGGQSYERIYNAPGLFNFMSSMISRGAGPYGRDELAGEFENMGASFSTSSGNNTFFIEASSLAGDYRRILELLKLMLTEARFDEEQVRKQKGFLLQAIEQQKNSWLTEAELNFKGHIFPRGSYYSYSRLGSTVSVSGIDRELLLKTYRQFSVPGNMVLSITGDLEYDEVIDTVRKTFGTLKKQSIPEADLPDELLDLTGSIKESYSTSKDLAVIFRGFPTVKVDDISARATLDIIDTMVSGGSYPGGWLHERLRSRELVYVVHAYSRSMLRSGYFAVYAATNPAELEKALTVIDGVFSDLRKGRYSDDEIARAKSQIVTEKTLSLQTPRSLARSYALNEILGFGYDFEDRYEKVVLNTTRKDIEDAVDRYFGNSVTVITSPETEKAGQD